MALSSIGSTLLVCLEWLQTKAYYSSHFLSATSTKRIYNAKIKAHQEPINVRVAVTAETQKIEPELYLLERMEATKAEYDTFVAELEEEIRQIMGELATPAGRVEEDSGIRVEKPVGHVSYADTAGKLANELANLPNFIARVRITNEADELVENTIRTLKPEQGLGEEKLKERIEWIKQHMIGLGYYRAKTEVDAEITKRHEILRQNGHLPPHKTSRKVTI